MRRYLIALCALSLLWVTGCTPRSLDLGSRLADGAHMLMAYTQQAGEQLADAALTLRVKLALSCDIRLQTCRIDVDTKAQIVTLRGSVREYGQRPLAYRIARDVVGDEERVLNRLELE